MLKTKSFGHPKARHKIQKNLIPIQGLSFFGDTIEEAAMVSLFVDGIVGKGPLAKTLKAEAKALVEKFAKANPEFKFSRFGRKGDSAKDVRHVEEPTPAKKSSKSKAKPKKKAEPELATA